MCSHCDTKSLVASTVHIAAIANAESSVCDTNNVPLSVKGGIENEHVVTGHDFKYWQKLTIDSKIA